MGKTSLPTQAGFAGLFQPKPVSLSELHQRQPQTSVYGRPIPIVYGTQRISGNIILAGWYMENKVTGKGGYASWSTGLVQIALCEGPISEVLNVWREQTKNTPAGWGIDAVLTGATVTAWSAATTYAKGVWASSGGTNYVSLQAANLNKTPASNPTWWAARGTSGTERAQSPWSHLVTNFPLFALGYGGTAIVCESTAWGQISDGQLERATFEVSGLMTTATGVATQVQPDTIIADLLTNQEYGVGLDTSRLYRYSGAGSVPTAFDLGVDGTYTTSYRQQIGRTNRQGLYMIGLALAVEEQRPAREIIEEIAAATNAMAIWSGGQLKMIPLETSVLLGSLGDDYDGPSTVIPIYDLGSSGSGNDFLADEGDDPISLEREALKDHFNCFPVEWSNRSPARKDNAGTSVPEPFNAYNADVEEGTPDPTDVAAYGLRKAPITRLPCIIAQHHAAYISNELARRSIAARNTYRFRLGWRFGLLEPSDIVTLTDSVLGLSRRLVRITEMEEDETGTFDVVAEEVGTVASPAAATYTLT